MNKIIKTTFILAVSAFMVTSCDFIEYKEVEYDEFHAKVSNLPENPAIEKLVISGKADKKVIDIVYKDGAVTEEMTEEEEGIVLIMALASGNTLKNIVEGANAKYYVGQFWKEGYKLYDVDESGEHTMYWDKYGNVTGYKDDDVNFTAKYTYKKE